MKQRDKLERLVVEFCNAQGSRTFSLQQLHQSYGDYSIIDIGGETPQATVRRLLQELRDDGIISFQDRSGHYTLRSIDLLDSERRDISSINIESETVDKKEYLVETYARSSAWVRQAKDEFGCYCLIDNCCNSFLKPDGNPYIEVHHIVPLHLGGEDGIWNLAVVCAHHHKMAHFASDNERTAIKDKLLFKVENKLNEAATHGNRIQPNS